MRASAPRDIPILFSAPMIKALIDGRKTQTRRLAWDGDRPTTWLKLWENFNFRPLPWHPSYAAGRDGLIYRRKGPYEYCPLKGSPTGNGYLSVSLSENGHIKTHSVHRLVCEAWHGPPPAAFVEVRHLFGNQTDNRPDYLDWGTKEQNWSDRSALGRGIHANHHAAKLSPDQIVEIRQSTISQRKLAEIYGVSQSTIWSIKSGETWSASTAAAPPNMPRLLAPEIWVRENFYQFGGPVAYAADRGEPTFPRKMSSSIHMPRWASRLTLTVTDVRVQRLNDISEADAVAEGIEFVVETSSGRFYRADYCRPGACPSLPWGAYRDLWESLHGEENWRANPFVVAVSFTVEHRNIDAQVTA